MRFKLVCINYKAAERSGSEGTGNAGGSIGSPMNAAACALKDASHSFCRRAKDWGFREFMPLFQQEDASAAYVYDALGGFLHEGTLSLGVLIEEQ